jgi:hypothetical protein
MGEKLRKLLKNNAGTAEIVGTVLFLVILFFFFSNVFLWHNQVSREMDQVVADKTNSAVRIETATVQGKSVNYIGWPANGYMQEKEGLNGYVLTASYVFNLNVTAVEKTLIADIRVSINASFIDNYGESCFVYIVDQGAAVNTGLMITSQSGWANATLPSSYIDEVGDVTIEILDASSQLGFYDNATGTLYITSMQVCADWIAFRVTNLGGSDAALSRLWVITTTDHSYVDLNNTMVAGGSSRMIMLNCETPLDNVNDIVVDYAASSGQTVTFKVLTTLGNTAACSYNFP